MAEESPQPVSTFWVTRNRRAGSELSYPEGFDEYASFDQNERATPTGRIKIAINGTPFVGTIEDIDAKMAAVVIPLVPSPDAPDYGSPAEMEQKLDEMVEAGVNLTTIELAYGEHIKPLHSGLKRNLKEEDRLRGYLDKLRNGSLLSDKELRFLIQYW